MLLCAIVDDTCLSQPEAVHSLQPSVTAGLDLPVCDEESSEADVTNCRADVDVSQTPDSGDTVFIRHDQVPLKAHCQQCSFTCNNASQLTLHIKTGHASTPENALNSALRKQGRFKCPECNMNTANKEVLIWHLSHHTGNHSVTYYACSGCDTKKQHASEIDKHITRKHSDGPIRCTTEAVVEHICYLQNIMKCPVCQDGLVWKHIFIEHLQDKHDLSDLARYLDTNYSEECPDVLSFPGYLLKSNTNDHADFVTEVADCSETLTISRFHCDSCEFSTNDSVVYRQHQNSHNRKEPSLAQKEGDTSSVKAAVSASNLYDVEKRSRTAKIKAYSRLLTPLKRRNQSSKQKLYRKSAALKRTTSRSDEYYSHRFLNRTSQSDKYTQPYFRRTTHATDERLGSKKVVSRPKSKDDTDFLTKFVSKLPSSYVFSEDVKCPQCYFASRVRVNLLRHIKSHMTANNKNGSSSRSSRSDTSLTYDLWKPDSSVPGEKPARTGISKVTANNKTAGSSSRSGSDLRKPDTSVPGHNTTEEEEEPAGTAISDTNDASLISMNSMDNSSQERLSTADADTSSQTESVCGVHDDEADETEADEADDEMLEQSERLSCETCSKEFDSDVDLERHISKSHGGPYVCHLCGILMWQRNTVRDHYRVMHPASPLLFEVLHKKAVDSSKEVGSGGKSKRKVARVQGNSQYFVVTCSSYIIVFTVLIVNFSPINLLVDHNVNYKAVALQTCICHYPR